MKKIIFKFLIKRRNINWTIDNHFRNPFRWNRCPVDMWDIKAWGVKIRTGDFLSGDVKFQSTVIFYFGGRFKMFIKKYKPF